MVVYLFIYLSLTTVAIIKIDVARQIVIQILQNNLQFVFRITMQYTDLQLIKISVVQFF